ncbi:MAG TPA: CHRD domain-containing protein [Actinomycetota bacterium]|nr:CHRD domain-containing protein [Actinomycetota bacterium]
MRRGFVSLLATVLVAGMFVSMVLVGTAGAYTPRNATLSGDAEVPGAGDPNGSGHARVKLYPAKGKICYWVAWSRIQNPAAGHIHKGPAGVAGPVKVTLFDGDPISDNDYYSACAKVAKRRVRAIKQRPSRWYVNLHNETYPDGAIRGQLHRPA